MVQFKTFSRVANLPGCILGWGTLTGLQYTPEVPLEQVV